MRFLVFLNHSIQGPYTAEEIVQLTGFDLNTSICAEGEFDWQPAMAFPAFTRVAAPVASAVTVQDQQKNDWRRAVIGSEMPDVRYSGSSDTSSMGVGVRMRSPSGSASRPVTFISAAPQGPQSLPVRLLLHRKGSLLTLLGGIAFGVYFPQTERLVAIYNGMTNPEPVVLSPKRSTRPAHRWATKINFLRHQLGTPLSPIPEAPKPPAVRPSEKVEIGSDDLGDGTMMKTYVITEFTDGVQRHRTATVIVPIAKLSPRHRRK